MHQRPERGVREVRVKLCAKAPTEDAAAAAHRFVAKHMRAAGLANILARVLSAHARSRRSRSRRVAVVRESRALSRARARVFNVFGVYIICYCSARNMPQCERAHIRHLHCS